MTARKHTPAHDFWHRRVEGQIRHTIGQHPGWFNLRGKREKRAHVNSLAKRIVGEIVAGCTLAPIPRDVITGCVAPVACGDAAIVSPRNPDVPSRASGLEPPANA